MNQLTRQYFLLDTHIVSDAMRNPDGRAAGQIARHAQNAVSLMCINPIVQCELHYGLVKRPSPRLQAAYEVQLRRLLMLPMDESICLHYAQLRSRLEAQGTPIGPNDALIAAHALALDATLVSADIEFTRVPGLKLQNWMMATD